MQRISYQIQACIGRLVLLLTKEFGQIPNFVVKTDNVFIIFTLKSNFGNGIKKMAAMFKCWRVPIDHKTFR